MIRRVIMMLAALAMSSVAMANNFPLIPGYYDYDGRTLGVEFGKVQWKVGFDDKNNHDAPTTCTAVMLGASHYYDFLSNDFGRVDRSSAIPQYVAQSNYYLAYAIAIANAHWIMTSNDGQKVPAYLLDAGREYALAVSLKTARYQDFRSYEYQLKFKDLERNLGKCERLFPNQKPAVQTPEPTIIQPIIPPKPPAKTYTEQETLIHGCAIIYDAYVRTLVEQSFADKSVTVDIRADRDPVWRKLRGRSIDAWAFSVLEKPYALPDEIKDGAKSMSQDALRDPGKFAELKTNIGVCDSLMKLPTIPLGY
jgi:hypothetical protein